MAKKVKDGARGRPVKKQPFVTESEPLPDRTAEQTLEERSLTAGQRQPDRTFEEERGGGPALSGGDIDAAWEEADSGEETVGGSAPTPDQDSVNQLGEALGIPTEENDETRDLLDIMRSHAPGSEQELPEKEEEIEELEELEEEDEEELGGEEEPR